jgi:hypothetical protein
MDPYATPNERKVGQNRPKIPHTAPDASERLTRKDRDAAKDRIAAQRRAIKKAARRQLKRDMLTKLEELS